MVDSTSSLARSRLAIAALASTDWAAAAAFKSKSAHNRYVDCVSDGSVQLLHCARPRRRIESCAPQDRWLGLNRGGGGACSVGRT